MRDVLPFVIAGLTSGSVFGLAGMGLVLTYKTSGVFNFAHGAVATVGAYLFYELRTQRGVPWPIAAAVTLAVFAPAMGVLLERMGRRLADATTAAKIVGTVGLLLAVQGGATLLYGSSVRAFEPFLPTASFAIGSTRLGYDQAIVVVVALVAAACLYLFFRTSRTGVAMRGVVDDADLLGLTGTSPIRVRVQAWVVGSVFAVLSGILIAPQLGLDSVLLTLLVVQAFGAAAIGRFSSLPLTHLGGLAIGVGASVATKYVGGTPSLSGLPPSLPFLVLFAALVLFKRGTFKEAPSAARSRLPTTLGESAPVPAVVLGLVALVALPHLAGTKLPVFTNGLVFVVIFMSLGLLVRTSGQVSLCHAGFAAMGATTFSHLAAGAGLPWLVAVLLAGLATVPVGAAVALPAIRLSGIFLALATFGFGILLERMVFSTGLMFGEFGNRPAPRPDIGFVDPQSDVGYYYVVLGLVVAVGAGLWMLQRSRLGLLLRGLADSPVALTTHGTSTNVTLVLVFCVAAFLAGVGGALFGSAAGSIGGAGFGPFVSLTWLTVLFVSGRSVIRSAFVAATLLAVAPAYLPDWFGDYNSLLFGAAAVASSIRLVDVDAVRARLEAAARAAPRRLARSPVASRTAAAVSGRRP